MSRDYTIAVLQGDGIGVEIMAPTLEVLRAATKGHGPNLRFNAVEAGATLFAYAGESLPAHTLRAIESADATLMGPMGLPDVRYPDGREIVPYLELRERLGLFAGLRPIQSIDGLPAVLTAKGAARIDFVIIRETTEGLFATRKTMHDMSADAVEDTLRVSRAAAERVIDFAFAHARQRKAEGYPGKVTLVDKADVLGSMAYLRRIFQARAATYTDLHAEALYFDTAALHLVRTPQRFDVIVTENVLGDMLAALGAGLVGGLGVTPAADVGEGRAVFHPCHGSAPDIAGSGKANPTGMFLCAAMMLDWLSRHHDDPTALAAAARLRAATAEVFAGGSLVPVEQGGPAGLATVARAVLQRLASTA